LKYILKKKFILAVFLVLFIMATVSSCSRRRVIPTEVIWNTTITQTSTHVSTSVLTYTATPTISATPLVISTVTLSSTSTRVITFTSTSTATQTSSATPVFIHPGAWSSVSELSFVKTQISANAQPWKQQLNNLLWQTGGATSGINFNGITQDSCTQETAVKTDSTLCYANALSWYLTGTMSYYTTAMAILSNYANIQGFQSSACYYGQQNLNAGWFGVLFANACELLRTSPNWTAANTQTYVNMFKTAFYPSLNTMNIDNGNIDLTQIDAMMSMAVFCDDKEEWNLAVSRYQARIPAYIYDSTWPTVNNSTNPDTGANQPPKLGKWDTNNAGCVTGFPMNFWYCPLKWIAGLCQETCRDNGHHIQFALDAAVECAEIDYHQGSLNNFYATYQTSLVPALELLAQQFYTNSSCGVCSGAWDPQNQVLDTFEIGFNHYANRRGMASTAPGDPLYYTKQWITSLRANNNTTWLQFNIACETLTHAGVN